MDTCIIIHANKWTMNAEKLKRSYMLEERFRFQSYTSEHAPRLI